MTKNEWERLFKDAINSLRQQMFVPYDTGNLKFNAIKGLWSGENEYTIYIDEEVAPYVFYTNEPWMNRSGINPNENWVDKMVVFITNYISQHTGGKVER